MNWDFLPVAIILLAATLAPAVLLVIARRKQKRPGGFVSIDPGLGRWNAFPLQLGERLTANPDVTTAEPEDDLESRDLEARDHSASGSGVRGRDVRGRDARGRDVSDDPVERIRQRRRREGRGR